MYARLALGNVRKSIRDFAIYFLTLTLGISLFYAFNSIEAQSTILSLQTDQVRAIELLQELVRIVSVVIAGVLGFLVVYASRFIIRRRKREFGLYLLLGMDAGKVTRVIVLEMLMVGVLSLFAGLVLGVALSQLMLYFTGFMFEVTIERFQVAFSARACGVTAALFALIFAVALVVNVITVRRSRLIKLLNAGRENETPRLRNLPLSCVLLACSVVLLGYAYWLLRDIGLMSIGKGEFAWCTACMVVGTVGLFFSLSGVAQRLVQASPRLYFRGLNMFSFRQLNARISSAFASMSVVSIVLFFGLTSTCAGFVICGALNESVEQANRYDLSLTVYWPAENMLDGEPTVEDVEDARVHAALKRAEQDGYSIDAGLRKSVDGYADMVKQSAQVDVYTAKGVNYASVLSAVDLDQVGLDGFKREAVENMVAVDVDMEIVRESQCNEMRKLAGEDPVDVQPGSYAIWADMEAIHSLWSAFLAQGCTIKDGKRELVAADCGLIKTPQKTDYQLMGTGWIVLDDDDPLFNDATMAALVFNVMVEGGWQHSAELAQLLSSSMASGDREPWPFAVDAYTLDDSQTNRADSVSNKTVITYLALYIGSVLLIACAAILALQQLSEASDNALRYRLLRDLGAEEKMVHLALLRQVGAYFALPLVVALCHSYVALGEVSKIVALIGGFQIVQPLVATAAFALLVYGGYFVLTYLASRSIIRA